MGGFDFGGGVGGGGWRVGGERRGWGLFIAGPDGLEDHARGTVIVDEGVVLRAVDESEGCCVLFVTGGERRAVSLLYVGGEKVNGW